MVRNRKEIVELVWYCHLSFKYVWFPIVLLMLLTGCSSSNDAGMNESIGVNLIARQTIYLGEAYASSSANVSIFRQAALLTVANRTFVSFYNPDGYAVVKVFDTQWNTCGMFVIEPPLPQPLRGDGHASISLGYSPDGRLHVIYGAHCTQPYYIAIEPNSFISVRHSADMIPLKAQAVEIKLTYPQFYTINNQLYLLYRNNIDRTVYFRQYDNDRGEWEDPKPLILADDKHVPYWDRIAVQGSRVAVSWVYRLPTDEGYHVRNEGIYVMYSFDAGRNWVDARGRPLMLPIHLTEVQPCIDIGADSGLMNQGSSSFGPDGKLYLVHQHKDSEGIPQIFLTILEPPRASHSDCQPQEIEYHERVSNNREIFELIGRGTLSLPLSRPELAISRETIYIIYRQQDCIIIASKPLYGEGTWIRTMLDTISLRNMTWEPNYDLQRWEQKGELVLYVQDPRQDQRDRPAPGPATSAYLIIMDRGKDD